MWKKVSGGVHLHPVLDQLYHCKQTPQERYLKCFLSDEIFEDMTMETSHCVQSMMSGEYIICGMWKVSGRGRC